MMSVGRALCSSPNAREKDSGRAVCSSQVGGLLGEGRLAELTKPLWEQTGRLFERFSRAPARVHVRTPAAE